jgi:hypothetical protein
VYTGNYSADWVRVELERLPPDELLDIFFGERWLLEVEAERRWADRRVRHLSHEGMPGMGGIEPHQLQFHKRKSIKVSMFQEIAPSALRMQE